MIKKQMIFAVLMIQFVAIIFLSGCGPMLIQNAVVASLPKYQESSAQWQPLENNQGRIVVYFTKKSMNFGTASHKMYIDDLMAIVKNGTYTFATLTSGDHSLLLKRGTFKEPLTLNIDLTAGDTVYIKVDVENMDENPPCIVETDIALKDLETSHHNYPKNLSLHAWHHNQKIGPDGRKKR
jgi:hypothetical protein